MFTKKKKIAEEFLRELMPIFESLRQRESLPCSYPLAMGPSRQTNTWVNCHVIHCAGAFLLLYTSRFIYL
jgi:hypothetical protein